MSRLVARNPFARVELHAERVHSPQSTCTWCGGLRRTVRTGKTWLYRFSIEYDSIGVRKGYFGPEANKLFCSRGCRSDYYFEDAPF